MKAFRLFGVLTLVMCMAFSAWAVPRPIATHFDGDLSLPFWAEPMRGDALDSPGDPVNWSTALTAGGNYLKAMQADITEDNAGNGSGGSESPDDPDDGGWDWSVTSPPAPFFHTTAASSPNMFGVQALGLYQAYVKNGYAPAAWFTAMTDAANAIVADALRRDASALEFLMLYNDLPGVVGTAYKNDARTKYDARIAAAGSASVFAANLRDTRGIAQGYPNGIIGWDLGAYAVAAQMLYDRFGSGYAADADAIAEVLWQDSFNDSPGLFDVVDDAGWDPTWANVNYWWYNLGISGLIDAFSYSNTHTTEIAGLVARIQASQYSNGAISGSYGANGPGNYDEDWQSTAYAAMALNHLNPTTYATTIAHAAYWTAATQDVSGGWLYGDNSHYPEVGAENLCAVALGQKANDIWVDDSWTSQADVDASPYDLVYGYDAFGDIQTAINNVGSSIINVLPGTYPTGIVSISMNVNLVGVGATRPIITPTTDTGSSGDARGWFVVAAGYTVNFTYLEFNGSGKLIHTAIRHHGTGTISDCVFSNIAYTPSSYDGRAVQSDANYAFTVQDCQFSNIYRIGTFFFGANTATKIYRRNTFTGKSAGDWLDYGVELGGGAVATIENSTITNCTGLAYDGSTSAAVLATTYFGGGTAGSFTGNVFTGSTSGLAIGYDGSDVTLATAYSNKMESNTYDVSSVSTNVVNASGNWWGQATTPSGFPLLGAAAHTRPSSADGDAAPVNRVLDADYDGLVDYTPWLNSNTDVSGSVGFQGDFSVLNVGPGGQQTGATGRIQEGVDMEVGSTVNVLAGTYYESQILISDAVNLLGAGAATTIIDAGGGTGLAIAGTMLITATDGNVTVDGFTLQNPKKSTDYMGVHAYGAPSGVTYTVSNCIIHGTNNSADPDQKDFGIYFHGNTGSCVASYNTIDQTNWNAILIETNPGATDMSYNTWDRGVANTSNDGYFNMNHDAADVTTLQKVSYNNVNMGNDAGPYDNDHRGFAITFSGAYTGTNGGFTNVQITNNVITNLKSYRRGIGLWNNAPVGADGDVVGAVITGNTITGVSLTGTQGIRELGQHTGSVITGNTISNVERAHRGQAWNGHSPTGTLLNVNNLAGNTYGTDWSGGSGTLNAECNWWGTLNYANILAKTVGLVDFENWNDATLTNCTYNNANTYDVTLSFDDAWVGCSGGASCTDAFLKVAFDRANVIGTDLVITLPSGIVANWTGDNYQVVPPSPSTNLNTINAAGGGTSTITLDVSWSPPYSTGAPYQYIAWLPVRNTGAGNGTYAVTIASYHYWDAGGDHTTGLDFSLPNIYVDCVAPTVTLTGGAGEGSCAGYNDATAFTNALAMTFVNTGTPASTPLTAQIVMTRPDLTTVTYPVTPTDGNWPPASVWTDMTLEGCYTFALTATDATCNTSDPASVSVIKDTVAPLFNPSSYFTQLSPCYNDITGDPNNGGTRLDTELDMSVNAPGACETGGFTLKFMMGVNNFTPITAAAVTNYPYTPQSSALWAFIVANTAPLYSGNVTVNWSLKDCLGNETLGSFTFCVDFAPPSNTFTVFDARPTYGGVWLKWNWTYDASQATAVEIYRKSEGDYPVYAGNLSMSDVNYEKVHSSLAGWTLAAAQAGPNNTAALYTGGGNIHYTDGVLGTYWKDAIDDSTARSIYRYVTFVRDAAGNWSEVGSYALLTNADRSTSYWLGNFINGTGPAGVVDGIDLAVLSAHYFASAAGWEFLDIGPENHENAYGKGIPDPDGFINFLDLMPFSYNFGVVNASSFHMPVPTRGDFEQLDAMPIIAVTRTTEAPIVAGTEFTVNVALTGNSSNATKIVEAQIEYDPMVLEFVEVIAAGAPVFDGVPFSVARAVEGSANTIGVVSAAVGEIAVLNGDFTMATLTFRWKSDNVPSTSLNVTSVQMADAYGHVIHSEGSVFGFGATGIIPTSYALYQNYPNPFNPTTLIGYDLPEDANVRLVIYNVMGQEVRTLVNGTMPAGAHHITWDGLSNGGQAVGTGVYIYRISANHFSSTQKMLLTR